MRSLLLTVLAFSGGLATAAPLLVSDGTDHIPEPTHCAFYFDGATVSVREPVTRDEVDLPRCEFDLANIQVGSHTVRAAFQIDQGEWGIEEGPLSDPFDFIRPPGAVDIPIPVLRVNP